MPCASEVLCWLHVKADRVGATPWTRGWQVLKLHLYSRFIPPLINELTKLKIRNKPVSLPWEIKFSEVLNRNKSKANSFWTTRRGICNRLKSIKALKRLRRKANHGHSKCLLMRVILCSCKWLKFYHEKIDFGAQRDTSVKNACSVARDPSLVLSTHPGGHTTTCNFSSRGFNFLFWPIQVPSYVYIPTYVYVYVCIYIHTHSWIKN